MSGSLARAAPVRFLIGVTLMWTIGRGVALAGWQAGTVPVVSALSPPPPPGLPAAATASIRLAADAPPGTPAGSVVPTLLRRIALIRPSPPEALARRAADEPLRGQDPFHGTALLRLAAYDVPHIGIYPRSSGVVASKAVAGATHPASRLSGTAWALVRGGGRATPLSPGGQIGGGQMGARLLYTVDRRDRIALSARVSRTIGGIRQTEAAAGLDWKPVASVPVHLMLERRFAIDQGGRNAWALGTAGGVDDVRIAPGWRLDGYGEAGVVGAHRRDLYVDGAARIARAIDLGGNRSLSLGGGIWGAAQPGAARLDIGPSAVLRAPVMGHVLAVALDWRERIAGVAKPGSGAALTVATDF